MRETLLVDGNNLFKIGFHGAKDLYNEGEHVGALFHFVNILRKFLEEHHHDKVIVFWDGEGNSSVRKSIYPKYKENRRETMNEFKYDSYLYQRNRVKQYLEEIFIRQIEVENNEADDLISYYCKIASDENIIIFSADKDLTQLISKKVSVYSPVSKQYFRYGDKIKINNVEIPHQNILAVKVFVGDKSDNIDGVEGLGEKTLFKFFPELHHKSCSIEDLLEYARNIVQNKTPKVIQNILTGKSKSGIIGEQLYFTNKKIIDLSEPLITDEGKELVKQIRSDAIDPTDRGYKNLMRMMVEDGLFKYLPKDDEAWVNFMRPFMKLIRKEKRKFN